MEQKTNTLSKEEKKFCELFVHGCAPYSGNMVACYEKAFGKSDIESKHEIIQLLNRTDVKEYIRTIEEEDIEEAKYLRKRLSENLLGIMEETSTAVYIEIEEETNYLLLLFRSVAVQAAKALMEIHPIKEAQINKLSIEGNEGGVVFNVIIPESKKTKEENGD